jgi:hypothetical protein
LIYENRMVYITYGTARGTVKWFGLAPHGTCAAFGRWSGRRLLRRLPQPVGRDGIDERSLFRGPEARARKCTRQELLN